MQKIPTLFVRDPDNMSRVTNELTPGCEWVLAGEGVATRKWDGTNVRVAVSGGKFIRLDKRRNPSRGEKMLGAEPGYVEASRTDPSNKHIFAAADATDFSSWPDGEWPCEALGPKIQGGADGMPPSLVSFSLPTFVQAMGIEAVPTDYESLGNFLGLYRCEGIVWHHPDGHMAKIKRRDFGHHWPVPQP